MRLKTILTLIMLSITSICFSDVIATANFSVQSELVDVGGYSLNFNITSGCGCVPTIIFEAGGGSDSSVWLTLSKAVSSQTGATTITYDRSGYGKSQANSAPYDITKEVEALEQGLKQLKINGQLVFVAHSYGGFLAALFAARNPEQVGGIVLIDANLAPFTTDLRLNQIMKDYTKNRETIQNENPNLIRVLDAFEATVHTMRKVQFPTAIPIIDIVAEKPPFEAVEDTTAWKHTHKEFVQSAANRKMVIANDSGHFVMTDKPALVAVEIVSMVSQVRCSSTKNDN
ncbi:alpha/beta fold hydrolase [Simkania negevensis]|uniref:Alpha/beta fold hydrolase n=1 Tax=Simkania negevensis TaxID=83561 RepID=A0ABS3APZ9_9BACT|nr:alpha/beta fold hydrolase [Simkania negevensis]